MVGGPFPKDWLRKQLAIELIRGQRFNGEVVDSTNGGCIIEREQREGDSSEPTTQRYFYPWTSILSIKLLEAADTPEELGGRV